MKINPTTLLFEDIPNYLRGEMLGILQDLILRGQIPGIVPEWAKEWFLVADPQYLEDPSRTVLFWSTSFPQRLALSLLLQGEAPQESKPRSRGQTEKCSKCGSQDTMQLRRYGKPVEGRFECFSCKRWFGPENPKDAGGK